MLKIVTVTLGLALFVVPETSQASWSVKMPSGPKTYRAPKTTEKSRSTGPIIGFKRGTCKTATCLAKHPTGEYEIPIHQKEP